MFNLIKKMLTKEATQEATEEVTMFDVEEFFKGTLGDDTDYSIPPNPFKDMTPHVRSIYR